MAAILVLFVPLGAYREPARNQEGDGVRVQAAEFVRSATKPAHFLRDGLPAVAFVGRSNVGKSSVLNRLLGRKDLARTSSRPGRTQTVNYFLINRHWYFVDLPGYGYAKASKDARREWAAFVDQFLRQSEPPPLVVSLVDAKVGATVLDQQAYEYFTDLGLDVLVVATKVDKVPRGRRVSVAKQVRERLGAPASQNVLCVSAVSGEGMKELWREATSFLDSYTQSHRGVESR